MSKRIGLVHATLNAVQPMLEAFRCHAPELGVLNFLDEGLVALANQSGGVTPAALRRLAHLVEMAATAGVDGVLTTCSAFSPYVPTLAGLVEVPVVSVDRAMLEQAASIGRRVVVVVTVAGAGPAAADQLRAIAGERGKRVEVTVAAVTEAFAALQAQDAALHDRLVAEKVEELASGG